MDVKSPNTTELFLSDPASIQVDILLPIIQRAHGDQVTEIRDWKCEQLSSGIGGGAIYRFSGQGQVRSDAVNWSVILKILKPSGKGWEDTNISD